MNTTLLNRLLIKLTKCFSISTKHRGFDPSEYAKQKRPKQKATEVVSHLANLPKQTYDCRYHPRQLQKNK